MKTCTSVVWLMVVACLLATISCRNRDVLFEPVPAEQSGIRFNNIIIENDTINPLDMTNIYNGGGVGIGDFNNDGLQDIYFSGNLVENKLYLNKGGLHFEDITIQAGVNGHGRWSRGVTIADVNNDGRQDIYVAASMHKQAQRRQNLLYINEGNDAKGIPLFKERAAAYGLNDTTHSTMAAFFDYDNDGDLDMYLVVNEIREQDNPSVFRPKVTDGSHFSTGRLYRNDYNDSLHHPFYTNVTREAGVVLEGYGHAVSIADFNQDGWKDIFVTNDFNSNDLLYINNHNGTFTDKSATYFKHTSANGMGQDVMDINNDGLADIIELDMNPEDNYRKKMMMGANNYSLYQNADYFGYQYQYVRNTLQLNQGPRVNGHDSIGDPVFTDIGYLAGMAETDWSWSVLAQDYDNDGWRDMIVTNGYPKDVTDHDFMTFRKQTTGIAAKAYTLEQIPQVKLHNYAYRNNGDLTFANATEAWGLVRPTFSNGAAYADLDNDGDLDFVINNINDEALVYKNNGRDEKEDANHYLQVQLKGDSLNRNGMGAWIELHYQGQKQVVEQTNVRGYLSSVQMNAHFGLGKVTAIDSVCVKWPDGRKQVILHVNADQVLTVNHSSAQIPYSWNRPALANALFTDITDSTGISFVQKENDYIDFNIQRLLPHKFSEYGPALAAGDINGDGFDDLVCGGSTGYSTMLFFQQPNGRFTTRELIPGATGQTKPGDDMGILLFDADMDNDLDIYTCGGGYESPANSDNYADRLFINDGKGNFVIDSLAIPRNLTSKSCVRATDYDKDGDLDLFIAGRVQPAAYPKPVNSFIYRNDSKNGKVQFADVTGKVAPGLNNVGLVCDAVWTDFDNDGWNDLLLAGEWMPVTFFKNNKGTFENVTAKWGIADQVGWWTSIMPGDFDNDGDMDYVVGNLGLNSFYKASNEYPVTAYAKDFDNNGSYDFMPALFLPGSQENPKRQLYIAQTRDDVVKQVVGFRAKYPNYKTYAHATFEQMFAPHEVKGAQVLRANNLAHGFLQNDGDHFHLYPLPMAAQFSCINGMVTDDFDGDGFLDVLINGNDYGTEISVGRYDGCNGLLLRGDSTGFKSQSMQQSGVYIPGNGKSLVKLRGASGTYLLAAAQNRGPLKIFALKKPVNFIQLNPLDVRVAIRFRDGRFRSTEVYHGDSFLSQSNRLLMIDAGVKMILITDNKGHTREIDL
jgi:hypothetical protein